MPEERIRDILGLLDPPPGTKLWHGGASALGALRGVLPEAAIWKPAPDRHSIWELVLHIAYWKYAVRRRITGEPKGGFPRTPSNWPAPPPHATAAAWSSDRAVLRDEHRRLNAEVARFDASRLDEAPDEDGAYSYRELFMGVVLHDTYHAGQIQLMKRLYASQEKG